MDAPPFVVRYKRAGFDVYRLELATGRRTLLWELAPGDPAGIDIRSVRLTADGQSYAYSFVRDMFAAYLVDGLR